MHLPNREVPHIFIQERRRVKGVWSPWKTIDKFLEFESADCFLGFEKGYISSNLFGTISGKDENHQIKWFRQIVIL